MQEKLPSNMQEKVKETPRQEFHLEIKKPFHEPTLTRHETLIQNTHLGSTGVTGTIGFGGL